jgi:stalled ribosome alternative rescue factor ArfA
MKVQKERELTTMAKKKKELDRRVFKKEGEDLQQWLIFTRRGSKAKAKKGKGSYDRQEFKKGGK